MKLESLFLIVVAAILGFVCKIIYDWLKTGRTEKGVFVKTDHCETIREKCCVPELKKDVGIIENRMDAAEKSLDRGREDFRLLRKDISEINLTLAGMAETLKFFLGDKKLV
ncbi:MAG: hypothetical protein HON48_22335 [Desulfobacula sp.]|nr:hypothetical protein [Desulfobacula sp.]